MAAGAQAAQDLVEDRGALLPRGCLVLRSCHVERALGDDELMNTIAAELATFTKPALLAFAADDKFFPAEHARRLAAILPDARVEVIAGSRTWVMLDQPGRTAELIAELARRAATQPAG